MTEEQFWQHVDSSGGPDACWLWRLSTIGWGYGQVWIGDTRWYTHRYVVSLAEPLDPDLQVLHSCDVPACCNPRHLRQGTIAENAADRSARNRVARGDRLPQTRLTPSLVLEIRDRIDLEPIAQIARAYDVGATTVRAIRDRRTWAHV